MTHSSAFSPLSMKRNFFWTWMGSTIYLAGQWLILTFLAKLGNVKLVGQYSLGLAITTPVIIFSQMQLRATLITDSQNEFHYLDCLWNRMILTVGALVFIMCLILVSDHPPEMSWVIVLIALAKSVESMSDIVYGRFQKFERMDFIAFSMIIKGLLSPLLFGLIIWKTGNLIWALAGMLLVWTSTLLFFDLPFSNRIDDKNAPSYTWTFEKFKKLMWLTLPLSISATLVSFSSNLPRYFLEHFQGKEGVGLFSVAAAPLIFVHMLQGSLGQAIIPRASRQLQTNERKNLKMLLIKCAAIHVVTALVFALAFAFWGSELLAILFSKDYAVVLPALLIMSLGAATNSLSVYGAILIIGGRMFNLQLFLTFLTVVFQSIICMFFIKKYGVWGAGLCEFLKLAFSNSLYFLVGVYVKNPFAKPVQVAG